MIDLYKDKEIPVVGNTINYQLIDSKTSIACVVKQTKVSRKDQVKEVL